MMKISNGVKAISLIILVLFIDQLVKIEIKTTMTIGESITVFGNWFFIKFIENPGMAFGLDIPGKQGKPILTIFRIIAVIAIGWYLRELVIKGAKTGLVLCVALIFAGAMGNIIDSVFYGILFNESTYFTVAQIFPEKRRIWSYFTWSRGRYAVFPDYPGYLSELVPGMAWAGLYLFQTDFQYSRFFHIYWDSTYFTFSEEVFSS